MNNDILSNIELTPDLIVRAYMAGIFPMAQSADSDEIFWLSPQKRGIIELDKFHISKSLKKAIKKYDYTIKIDSDFSQVISACTYCGSTRETSWINQKIKKAYGKLFERKICHTVEVWREGEMIGGLYGISIGAAFFGESMFHKKTNASKIALAYLIKRLIYGGYKLLDTQFMTDHLRSLGGSEIDREIYEQRLNEALSSTGDFYKLPIDNKYYD